MPPSNPTSPTSPKHHAIAKDQYMRRLMDSRVFGFLSKTERGVLLCYARHMNDRWSAWPGASRVAEQAGVSVGRAKIARAVLIRCGLLEPLGKVPGLAVHRYRVVETGWEDLTKTQRDEAATIPSRRRPGRSTTPGIAPGTTATTGRACAPTAAATPGAPARHHRARQRATTGRASAPQKSPHEETPTNVEAAATPSPPPPPPGPPSARQPGLYDDDDALRLLLSTGQWDGSDPRRVADARRIVQGCGAKAVRDGVAHAQYLQRTGRLKGTLRGCIVTAAQGYRTGSWAPDPGMAAEAKRQQQAKQAQASAQRKAHAQRQAADRLAAEEDANRLLWSQLSADRRAELHRAVVARIGPNHPFARMSIDSPPMRALILDELESKTA